MVRMDWKSIIAIIGTVASCIGAYIAWRESKRAEEAKTASEAAKDAVEAARDKIIQNIQLQSFNQFKKDCEKFCGILQEATANKVKKGRSVNYLENEFERFVTKLNDAISVLGGETRRILERKYSSLQLKRNDVYSKDRASLIKVLDDVREISRFVSDIQMKNTLTP